MRALSVTMTPCAGTMDGVPASLSDSALLAELSAFTIDSSSVSSSALPERR